jgi:putative ABC transport system ATP-binding protein
MANLSHPPDNPPHSPIVSLRGVIKSYKTAAGDFQALKGIDLEVYPGEFLGIIGKSGAGKTTLVNMVTGVDHLTAGEVWVKGIPLHRLGENQLALWRGRNLGIVYQAFHLMPTLSLLDNIMLPMDLCGMFNSKKSPQCALELLRQVGLEEHAHKLPSEISGGQQQRVAIARALANDPPLIVADEPTGRLDSSNAENIFQIFLALVKQGKTILMVTHDSQLAQRVSRVLPIADGRIATDGYVTQVSDAALEMLDREATKI